ncbi:MAG TPA: D-alanyl-D-alanine carboxypeptidase family protein [Patescibacteria group bacterium]|nr:D-alanyl-D-alanine carboxypeptidase family protein [Patescibacteria group bacterium]
MTDTSGFIISTQEKISVDSIFKKLEDEKKKKEFRVVSFESLFKLLDENEQDLIKRLLKVNPLEFGFKGKFYGIQEVPTDLVEITNQQYRLKEETKAIDTQFLPQETSSAYEKLNQSLFNDTKKKLLVLSGYRSPAYQAFVFLWYLKEYEFDFTKTLKRAALPGYSEHGFPDRQAIDFITEDGSPSEKDPENFEKTVEYTWLTENANKFNFHLTNPRDNQLGTMYEPWHWAYVK